MEESIHDKKHGQRFYRNIQGLKELTSFRVMVKETDLFIYADKNLEQEALASVINHRAVLEAHIQSNPDFYGSLKPMRVPEPAPRIIRQMAEAGQTAGVGPMAAVAGVLAEAVGRDLLELSGQVVVENGGDIFLKTEKPINIGVYAGDSPLSLRIGIKMDSRPGPLAVCTSSGTVGHSLSKGQADAICVISDSCALADAAATSIGNQVLSKKDIARGIEFGKSIQGVNGLLIVKDDQMGMWGEVEVVPV